MGSYKMKGLSTLSQNYSEEEIYSLTIDKWATSILNKLCKNYHPSIDVDGLYLNESAHLIFIL
jgi:hypothetical protein